jgi:gamma-glutamylcyclotransferase
MPAYFAYGSNMNLEWVKERCPGSRPLRIATLHDYLLSFRYPSTSWPGGGACDIVRCKGSLVWGVLFEVSEADLQVLDDYEDVAQGGYRRIPVAVNSEGFLHNAISYEVVEKLPQNLKPVDGYLDLVIAGAEQNGLPRGYIESVRRLAASSHTLN